jgi:hypothetical protein
MLHEAAEKSKIGAEYQMDQPSMTIHPPPDAKSDKAKQTALAFSIC